MSQYKVIEETTEGSSIGAHEVGAVVEIEDQEAADALVASGHVEAVTE